MDQSINYYRIEKAIGYLSEHFKEQPDLRGIAEKINMSPFHFQKIFLDWVGITPKKFLQYLTLSHLKSKIHESRNVIEAAAAAGLSSQSRVYDLFVNIEGVSPQQYKTGGLGLEIFYGYHPSPFGMCFIAVAEKGVCDLHFIDEDHTRDEYIRFAQKWNFATLIHKPDYTQAYMKKIFRPAQRNEERLNVLVQGNSFQIKVWEALVKIPFGHVSSYQQVAKSIGCANAVRSVATAAGKNPILYLIPCHRIIKNNGSVGDFDFGRTRKKTMIAWEMASIVV
jgi:AraC family transcriptional regulator, regulatory protein of adaptative response / methylated-DNA-[protein]-cysteine methyltransferase